MITVIVSCQGPRTSIRPGVHPTEALVRTLASLVAPTVTGLVRHVMIAGAPGLDLPQVADQAGCAVIEADREEAWLSQAINAARHPDLLILRAGWAPEAAFAEEIEDRLARPDGRAGVIKVAPEGVLQRLAPTLAPIVGILGRRDRCLAAPRTDFVGLAAFLRPAATLRSRARPTG